MNIGLDLINGVAIGIEYIPAMPDIQKTIILDLLLIRILFQW